MVGYLLDIEGLTLPVGRVFIVSRQTTAARNIRI